MKSTEHFKKVIHDYLYGMAEDDPSFQVKFLNPSKSIDKCITYILNTVQKSGLNGFADEEIFGMAIHYYDEEKIDEGKPIDCQVVINRQIKLTDEEIAQARQKAMDDLVRQEMTRMREKKAPAKPVIQTKTEQPIVPAQQQSLF